MRLQIRWRGNQYRFQLAQTALIKRGVGLLSNPNSQISLGFYQVHLVVTEFKIQLDIRVFLSKRHPHCS